MAGSFLHLHLGLAAFPLAFGVSVHQQPRDLACFLAGTLAPDVGYYPLGPKVLSDLVHRQANADLTRAMLQQADSTQERAFAAGWALHVETDVTTHPRINTQVREYHDPTRENLWHKRVEWGVDQRLLQHADPRLASLTVDGTAASDLLWRCVGQIYGEVVDPSALRRGVGALGPWVRRLARFHRKPTSSWKKSVGQMLEPVRSLEDLVALLTTARPTDELLAQLLEAGNVAVSAFQRSWSDEFRSMVNRDLDTGAPAPGAPS